MVKKHLLHNFLHHFLEVKGFRSEKDLTQHYFKNPNGTVLAVLFRGNNTKHLDYAIRYHDEYGYIYDFLKTAQLYSKNMFEYYPERSKFHIFKCINTFSNISMTFYIYDIEILMIFIHNYIYYFILSYNLSVFICKMMKKQSC